LHTAELKACESVNVISGKNDVGKSNVLKSLNLFFNEQTDWESSYKFYDNFSKKRLEEVRQDSIKGKQFISIKIEFLRPKNYKGSLPSKFWVERKWNRDSKTYEQKDNLTLCEKKGALPGSLTAATRSLAKMLNKTHFEYVPAIKDRAYINELLARLQNSLIGKSLGNASGLEDTANSLATHIEEQITDLKEDFESATSIETSIKPPTNIAGLFQSFLVATQTIDGEVPLMFRGDGLQARFIGSVLYYIALNSTDFYIWGYEEPEIALEYSHVSKMADEFCSKYSKKAQIFLTTHSPAFISLDPENAVCYRASKVESATVVSNIALGESSINKDLLREELGIIEIQKEVHELYSKELQKLENLNSRIAELEGENSAHRTALVVTEGKTDRKILDAALSKLQGVECQVVFRECDNGGTSGGNGGAGTLKRMIESIHPKDNRKVIAIFDNDLEGQKEFNSLSKNFSVVFGLPDYILRHSNGFAWAFMLQEPSFRGGYVDAKNLCIEYLFEDTVLNMEFSNGHKLEVKDESPRLFMGSTPLDIGQEVMDLLASDLQAHRKIGRGKDRFASEIVPNLDASHFQAFRVIFDTVSSILEFTPDQ
jgi:AAA15 family ATPase/GTPase